MHRILIDEWVELWSKDARNQCCQLLITIMKIEMFEMKHVYSVKAAAFFRPLFLLHGEKVEEFYFH